MPSPVILAYCHRLIPRLVADGKLLLGPGASIPEVAEAVAEGLTGLPQHAGLISNTIKALVALPEVDELFIEDEELQHLVNSLRQ